MKIKRLIIALFVVIAGYILIFSTYGVSRIGTLYFKIWKAREEIKIMEARKLVLERESKLLTNDKEYIKKVAQERFGME
jgi:cell division protein FtsB